MKVVLFSTGFPEYMISLANALAEHVHVVLMLPANHRLTNKHVELIDKRVKLKTFNVIFFKSIRQNLKMIWHIVKIIRAENPDVLHIQSNGHPWFPVVYFFMRRSCKLVNTVHDPIKHLGDKLSLKHNDSAAILFGKWFTDKYIVHGNLLKEQLCKVYDVTEEKVVVIPHGNLEIYKRFQHVAVEEDDNLVLFFGRIWEYKGLDVFIAAANLVIEKKSAVKFLIAGTGEDLTDYKKAIKYPNNFIFKNYRIPMEEAGEIYQRASIVVLPYKEGTQSGIIPVAYAYKKPVIVTRTGSLPEVVKDGLTGFIVEPGDIKGIAEKIIFLIENKAQRLSMGNAAYQMATTELSWQTIAEKTVAVYKDVI